MALPKALLESSIAALFCLSVTASAQVSNVEGLKPLEGVTIPKVQLNTENKPVATFKDCGDCPEMVIIPAGSFLMGLPPFPKVASDPFSENKEPETITCYSGLGFISGDEAASPQHLVQIKSFAIGKYEVTQEEWYAVMGTNPSRNKGRTLPVEKVSWDDAQKFVERLSKKTGKKYRLPSEAEWEYVARGGTNTTFHWGDDASKLFDHAWVDSNSDNAPVSDRLKFVPIRPVGLKTPNQFGVYDILGNVEEWTQDCWKDNYKGAPTDGSARTQWLCDWRVSRGFSVDAKRVRNTACRHVGGHPAYGGIIGFRVAREN